MLQTSGYLNSSYKEAEGYLKCYKKSWALVRLSLLKPATRLEALCARDSICKKPSALTGPLAIAVRQPSATVSCSAPGVSARAVKAYVPVANAACNVSNCLSAHRFLALVM